MVVHLLSGKRVVGDSLLYAMGRLGNTDSLNLEVKAALSRHLETVPGVF